MQSPHFEVVDCQRMHSPALHGDCTHGETSDGQRTNRGCAQGERAECDGPNRSGPSSTYCTVWGGCGSWAMNGSNFWLGRLNLIHVLPLVVREKLR
jgi:hypothetical protein